MTSITDCDELEHIITHQLLQPVYQPIISLNNHRVYGYEALIRGPADSPLCSPKALFAAAAQCQCLSQLELSCREISCRQFHALQAPGKLFLNVSPMSLTDRTHQNGETLKLLDTIGLSPQQVVIELSEQYPLDDIVLLQQACHHYRAMGFEIAIDDLGAGYAGLKAWSELRPDYVKIDRHFIEGIDSNAVGQKFVRSILDIGRSLGCRVVAEGVETEAELAVLESMGLDYVQGYYLGRPEPQISAELSYDSRYRVQHSAFSSDQSDTIQTLARKCPPVPPQASMDSINELFLQNKAFSLLPIVDDGRPVGVIYRNDVLELFSRRFNRELHGRKQVVEFMQSPQVVVPHDAKLEYVSRLLTSSNDDELLLDFIITEQGRYLGIGRTFMLLRRITDQKIQDARHANPLTLLPGNIAINQEVDRCLQAEQSIHVVYMDLNSFKPYNDYYGYAKGDEVIRQVAALLRGHFSSQGFLGHVGGDDFVAVVYHGEWQKLCDAVLEDFLKLRDSFYSEEDVLKGGISGEDRSGNAQFFDLLGIVLAVVNPDPALCRSHHQVAALCSDAKKQAKAQGGSCCFYSRRRH